MFVRKKNIKGRDYYYLVATTRLDDGTQKRIEQYLGLHAPSPKELKEYENEFSNIKVFFDQNKAILETLQKNYLQKIKCATKDELHTFENEFLIQFTFDTNRIEGSKLSYKDTKYLLDDGITPREKPLRDIKETENHKRAFEFMKEAVNQEITVKFILTLHKILKQNVTEDAGFFRTGQVRVGTLIPVKADMIQTEIENLLEAYYQNKEMHPLECAVEFHTHFERIHPFFDGNGRVGRLLLNFILLKSSFPPIIVQNKNKRRYYTALQRADDGNILPMLKYLLFELQEHAKKW